MEKKAPFAFLPVMFSPNSVDEVLGATVDDRSNSAALRSSTSAYTLLR